MYPFFGLGWSVCHTLEPFNCLETGYGGLFLGASCHPLAKPRTAEDGEAPNPQRLLPDRGSLALLTGSLSHFSIAFKTSKSPWPDGSGVGNEDLKGFHCTRAAAENRWHTQHGTVRGESIYKEVFTEKWVKDSNDLH